MINFTGLGLAGMSFTDQPPLTQACFRNNPDEIRSLIFKVSIYFSQMICFSHDFLCLGPAVRLLSTCPHQFLLYSFRLIQKEDVNSLDSERRSPLHAAAFCGEGDIAELLIMGGARVNAKDSK